jgi:G3E family GTPase
VVSVQLTTTAVTVLSGFVPSAVQATAQALLLADDRLVSVSHDITGIRDGIVLRTVRTATEVLEHETVRVEHGCVACTLREDVVPTLARLAAGRPGRDLLLVLPHTIEPESVATACGPLTEVRFDSYVTVVDTDRFLDDLTSGDDLRHRGLHAADDDHRTVADVVVHQVEFSDTLILWSRRTSDPDAVDRLGALVHRLAPWAVQVPTGTTHSLDISGLSALVRGVRRHDPERPGMLGLALEGRAVGVHEPSASVVFRSRRPFHPQRLHDALDELTTDTVRGRGQLWIASQPDLVIAFESAGGGVSFGSLGNWLDALPAARWTEAGDQRRFAADLSWHPYYGDRGTVLALIGLDLDDTALISLLSSCLPTDEEVAAGFEGWRALPDPFRDCFAAR